MSPDCASAPTLILTRPKAASLRFAEGFRRRVRLVISPLIEIEKVDAAYSPAEAVIFSSQNAVESIRDLPDCVKRRAYCVGAATAAAAKRAGFEVLGVAETAASLEQVLRAAAPRGPLLHLRGDVVAYPLAERLNQAGIETNQAVIYRQSPQPMTDEAREVLASGRPCIAPLFSPRSARLFAEAARGNHPALTLIAMSDAVAKACDGLIVKEIRTASAPDAQAMRQMIEEVLGDNESG